jgi:trans-aconitate methyltransferase
MSFDALAPIYRHMELAIAGDLLQKCRLLHLNEAVGGRRALLIGEGPGRFLIELMRRNPSVHVTCIEQSSGMIREAARQIRRQSMDPSRIEFHEVDALNWDPAATQQFDLVVTHFFLDCFPPEELRALVAKVGVSARVGALWLVSDFCIPESGWRSLRAKAIHAAMYAFFRAVTRISARRVTPPDGAMEAAGFRLARRHNFSCGLLHSDLWIKDT